jgi:anaerobic glycerol-3-phosphate dehydrogenase
MRVPEVLASTRRQSLIDFIGINPAACTDQMGKDCGIVAASRPNLHHGLGLLDVAGSKPIGMSAGHPNIDPALAI